MPVLVSLQAENHQQIHRPIITMADFNQEITTIINHITIINILKKQKFIPLYSEPENGAKQSPLHRLDFFVLFGQAKRTTKKKASPILPTWSKAESMSTLL